MQVNALPDSQPLLTTFPGRVAGQSAKVFIDNGATDNYVDAAFAAANGLQVTKCEDYVLAGGKEQLAIHGYVCARIHIQSFSEEVKLYVIDLPSNSMQAVLGQSWLRAHRAVISHVDNCVMYFSSGRRHKLWFSPNAPGLPFLSADSSLLTRLQLKTMCKDKQNKLFLVHVSTVDEPSEVEEGELSTESENIALPQAAKHIITSNALYGAMPS